MLALDGVFMGLIPRDLISACAASLCLVCLASHTMWDSLNKVRTVIRVFSAVSASLL